MKDKPMEKETLYFGRFGSGSVPVLATSKEQATEKLKLAGYGPADRIVEYRR